jgi:hypothetical protein
MSKVWLERIKLCLDGFQFIPKASEAEANKEKTFWKQAFCFSKKIIKKFNSIEHRMMYVYNSNSFHLIYANKHFSQSSSLSLSSWHI